MDLHLRGKRVLITGASKGIGAAAAEAFAEEGCDVMLAARNGEQLKALAERLRSDHQIDAPAHVVDLRKREDIARSSRMPPTSTSSSTMPAISRAARSTRSTRRPGARLGTESVSATSTSPARSTRR
jgi:NAD(P)-dependent dehydrogenase (short-subunit alcohol dehydrogenase family)